MSDGKIAVKRLDSIALVTLNDPKTRNSLSDQLVSELVSFVVGANADRSIGCIVLAAEGEGFCSGGNVKDMLDRNGPMFAGSPEQMQEGYRTHIQQMTRAFHALDVPVVAAVHGNAIGAGCDLTCMCDIRVAASDAQFAESFLRVGLVSGDGGAWLLPRIVGLPRALDMALTCRMVDANEAKEWGLVSQVVERGAHVEAALEIARKIAALPPVSVRLNKRLIKQSLNLTLDACLEISAAYQAMVQSTADQREALAALIEKRPPRFIGA